MTESEKYVLSFTAASLFIAESIKIAEAYLKIRNWNQVRKFVKSENLLQSRTGSRTQRIYNELSKRLKTLSQEQLELLVDGNYLEQKYLLWFSVCKCYTFIRDFATEVLREKFLAMDYHLTYMDYEAFYNRKSGWHDELDAISETTRKKLRQVLFRMLKEAELLSPNQTIVQAAFTERLAKVLSRDTPMSFQVFPILTPDAQGEHL